MHTCTHTEYNHICRNWSVSVSSGGMELGREEGGLGCRSGKLSPPFPRKVFPKAMKGKFTNSNMMQIQNKETKKIVENNSKVIYRGETWKRKNVLQST